MGCETAAGSAMKIFRAAGSVDLEESGRLTYQDLTPVAEKGMHRMFAEGSAEGYTVRHLFAAPGFDLSYLWLKSGFPLPLHKHDVDCLYLVVAGRLRLGTTELGVGDGFFVPSATPYSYTPGEDGVELLEFRHSEQFGLTYLGATDTYWDKLVARVQRHRSAWHGEWPSALGCAILGLE